MASPWRAEPYLAAAAPYVFVGGSTEPGGLHVHTAEVARALAASGHPVTIVTTAPDYFSQLVADSAVRVLRVDAVDPAGRPRRRAPAWRPLLEVRRSTAWWRDVLEPLTPARGVLVRSQAGAGPLPLLLAARRLFGSVATIEHRLPDPVGPLRRALLLPSVLVGRRTVGLAVAVSEEVAAAVAAGGSVRPDRIAVCPNWVDGERFRPDAGERRLRREALGFGEGDVVLGIVGRLAPEKRVAVAIRGFGEYLARGGSRCRLLVVGGGWQEASLRSIAAASCPPGSVTFAGWVEDTAPWYKTFDALLLPSELEGFPLVLLEAMASGVPCVARPVGGTRGCVEDGVDGILAPMADAGEIAALIAGIVAAGPARRTEMGSRARASVLRRFAREAGLAAVLEALGAPVAAARARAGAVTPLPRSFAFRPAGRPARGGGVCVGERVLVSVVIPTYNRRPYLADALASVRAQTWPGWECVVADDGSSDGTRELVESLAASDGRIRFLPFGQRTGPGAARNRGVAAATGSVVAFLDSDDRWMPTALEGHLACRGRRPLAEVTAGDYSMVDRGAGTRTTGSEFLAEMVAWWSTDPILRRMRDWRALLREGDLRATRDAIVDQAIGGFLWMHTSSVAVDRRALDRAGGFDEHLLRTEDILLWLRLAGHHAVAFADELLAEYDVSGRDDATGERYAAYDREARHGRALELRLHLRLLGTIRDTFPLAPPQARALRAQRRRFHEKLAAVAASRGEAAAWRLRRRLSLVRDAVAERDSLLHRLRH